MTTIALFTITSCCICACVQRATLQGMQGWLQDCRQGQSLRPWCHSQFPLHAPPHSALFVQQQKLLRWCPDSQRSQCAFPALCVEAIVAAGVASSDGSVALGWEPSCSSSVLPIVIGEVGDSLASGLTGSGTSVGGAGSALSSELVSLRLISARAALSCVLCVWAASAGWACSCCQ